MLGRNGLVYAWGALLRPTSRGLTQWTQTTACGHQSIPGGNEASAHLQEE